MASRNSGNIHIQWASCIYPFMYPSPLHSPLNHRIPRSCVHTSALCTHILSSGRPHGLQCFYGMLQPALVPTGSRMGNSSVLSLQLRHRKLCLEEEKVSQDRGCKNVLLWNGKMSLATAGCRVYWRLSFLVLNHGREEVAGSGQGPAQLFFNMFSCGDCCCNESWPLAGPLMG